MINKRLIKLKKLLDLKNLDGYIIPKNDEFFSEYSKQNRLKIISNFSGSAGFAIILKDKNYLFVDGRYTVQSKIECGKYFKIFEIPKIFPYHILNKKLKIGFDPHLFTSSTLKIIFTVIITSKTLIFSSKFRSPYKQFESWIRPGLAISKTALITSI